MKKWFIVFLSLFIMAALLAALPVFSQKGSAENFIQTEVGRLTPNAYEIENEAISVTSVRSVLIEAGSGSILHGKKAHERAGMASTTKIMTALVVLNNIPVDNVFTIPKAAVGIEGSSVYLIEGEKLTVEELLYGLLLASGNDCAVALALACSGSLERFVEEMNRTAADMGLDDTHFTNPHGLSDDNHYTSAYSLALITAEALRNETFKKIVSTKRAYISYNNAPKQRCLTNHNRLLGSYNGAIGVKTGFTKATGRCLVSAAERDGIMLVAVTLNDGNDWASHRNMLDYGFSEYESVSLAEAGSISVSVSVVGGKALFVNAENNEAAQVVVKKGSKYTCKLKTPHFLYAPVKEGDIVAYAEYYDESGGLFYRIPLVAAESVEMKKLTFFEKIFGVD